MTMRRSGLGRGLDALIPGSSAREPAAAIETPPLPAERSGVEEVDIDFVTPNPYQPRTEFAAEALQELADSIREHGIIQPLIVTRADDGATYQLIAGERRLLAARQAGLARVPVVVKEATPRDKLELAIVENLQRADLGPLEEAEAFHRLSDEFALTQDQIARRVGRSRPAIANSLRLLTLPDDIRRSLARGEITAGHARAILGLDDPAEQRRLWQRILEAGLNVREAEALAKSRPRPVRATTRMPSVELTALEERLRSSLGTKVELTKSRRGGKLTLYFYSDEELEGLIDRLG